MIKTLRGKEVLTTGLVGLEVPKFGTLVRQIASVTTEDVELCLDMQSKVGGRLGDIMVGRNLITSTDVIEVLRQQAQWAARMRSPDLAPSKFPLDTYFSLVLPCYNEGDVIAGNLDAALAILPEFVSEFEIIVVNDGSSDDTSAIVERYADADPRVRLVSHEKNRGYGGAVTSGFRAASGDLICLNDGDGQFSLVDLPQLLVEFALGEVDAVFGYRYRRADVLMRSVNSRCWNLLLRMMLGIKIRDLDCAFKLLPRWAVEQIQLCAGGACISGEIVAQCIRGGLRIREVPVNHHPRYHGDATGANLNVIGRAFRELPGLWKYRNTPQFRRPTGSLIRNYPHASKLENERPAAVTGAS